ncbi:dynein regulatory complex subunit 3 [Symphorus nematophorus]
MSASSFESLPVYLNDELLLEEIMEQLNNEGRVIAKREGIHFSEVRKLCVKFRGLRSIENLWEFTSLTRLELNSNLIEKIEGLDRLVNLTWLNLSFNSIRKIEGLDSLWKLEVLNLTRNKISVIENMDTLERLTHFSIAKNHLEQQDNVLYLRKFKKLFALTLEENPAFKGDDYKLFIVVHFPELKYIEDTVIDDEMRNAAAIKYSYISESMRFEEEQKQEADGAKQRQEAEIKLHKDAFVEELNGPHLFKSMFEDDLEAETLHRVPGVPPLLQTYPHQTVELCMQLFEAGLTEHKRREAEVSLFTSGVTKTKDDCKQQTRQILAEFDRQHRESSEEMLKISDPDLLKAKIDYCCGEISELRDVLMTLELHLFSELEIRDLEDKHHEKVQQIALATLKNVAEDDLGEDFPNDVKMLFTVKDTVMEALDTCHNNHLLKVSDRETQLEACLSAWKVSLIKEIKDKDLKEHRKRLRDIIRYGDYLTECLEMLLPYHKTEQL